VNCRSLRSIPRQTSGPASYVRCSFRYLEIWRASVVSVSRLFLWATSRRSRRWLSVLYALTIIGGAIGEWNYYILGSTVEVAMSSVTSRRVLPETRRGRWRFYAQFPRAARLVAAVPASVAVSDVAQYVLTGVRQAADSRNCLALHPPPIDAKDSRSRARSKPSNTLLASAHGGTTRRQSGRHHRS
jgi:hypothetical protein